MQLYTDDLKPPHFWRKVERECPLERKLQDLLVGPQMAARCLSPLSTHSRRSRFPKGDVGLAPKLPVERNSVRRPHVSRETRDGASATLAWGPSRRWF